MKTKIITNQPNGKPTPQQIIEIDKYFLKEKKSEYGTLTHTYSNPVKQAEVLIISSYPPRECGIATYSQDLKKSLDDKFSKSFSVAVCALESGDENYEYPPEVKFTLNTSTSSGYHELAMAINEDENIAIVLMQHEFGFFMKQENAFIELLHQISKPVVLVFHTILPHPDEILKQKILQITQACAAIVVMTKNSAGILSQDYGLPEEKISVIAHGTHLVSHLGEKFLKMKYGLKDRKVLTTFGLLSSGKSIETTIDALPAIVKRFPETVFLVIGKTHPEVVKNDGEKYRESLELKVKEYGLQDHVIFINKYLTTSVLLEYLQLTDIYLFTSNDPNQAVSGTFAYAMSCACPIISTPIPHAREILTKDTGVIIDFKSSVQLKDEVLKLLKNKPLRKHISTNSLQKIISTSWENSAIEHAILFENLSEGKITLEYNLPSINMDHLKHMTNNTGIIQFSKLNQADLDTGYTLDDNARAMIVKCMHFRQTGDLLDIKYLRIYLAFIKHCLQPSGNFLNYVDKYYQFTEQNQETNLDDSNGRAVWALGYLISLRGILPEAMISEAREILVSTFHHISTIHSTRAMAFAIKGLYYYQTIYKRLDSLILIKTFSDRLEQMYIYESEKNWEWYEGYLTYANSVLPEAMLYAWLITGEPAYKETAINSMDFLLTQIFDESGIKVISNKTWLQKGQKAGSFGEQPIDVAYTIMTLSKFYDVFRYEPYLEYMRIAFDWFLGKNHLHQIIYNPCTGGCYDGLEENNVNLNQGSESTVSYLMARLTLEQYVNSENMTE